MWSCWLPGFSWNCQRCCQTALVHFDTVMWPWFAVKKHHFNSDSLLSFCLFSSHWTLNVLSRSAAPVKEESRGYPLHFAAFSLPKVHVPFLCVHVPASITHRLALPAASLTMPGGVWTHGPTFKASPGIHMLGGIPGCTIWVTWLHMCKEPLRNLGKHCRK